MGSRQELIGWVNDLLLLSYNKVEQCGTGAAYVQICDSIYGNVPMTKLNFAAKHDYEYINNFKVLQEVFKKNKIDKPIPVERLIKCKMQDNLEFLQWIKKFWDQNYPGTEYDAEGRRAGLGVAPPPLHGSTARPVAGGAAGGPGARAPAPRAPAAAARPAAGAAATNRTAAPRVAPTGARLGAGAVAQAVPDETIQALTNQMDEMKLSVDSLEKERDFYFSKLRDIEVLIVDRLDLVSAEAPGGPEEEVLKQIQAVLYKTEEGFEVPEGQEPIVDEEEVF